MALRYAFTIALALNSCALTAGEILTMEIASEVFHLEVARSVTEHRQGLMGRRTLAPNTGMVFLFEEPQTVAMWMKDTPLNLDVVYVDACGIVFHTDTMRANSLSFHPSFGPAASALELPHGTLTRLRIQNGMCLPELVRKEYCKKP